MKCFEYIFCMHGTHFRELKYLSRYIPYYTHCVIIIIIFNILYRGCKNKQFHSLSTLGATERLKTSEIRFKTYLFPVRCVGSGKSVH